jgi:hypothetical protein
MMQDLSGPVIVRDVGSAEDKADSHEDVSCPDSGSLAGIRVRRPQPVRLSETPGNADDITAYWERLRGKRAFPSRRELDDKTLGFYWPYSVIFRIEERGERIEVEKAVNPMSSIKAGWLRSGGDGGKLQFVITEWLMPLVRVAAVRGIPVDESALLPLDGRAVRYRCIALPFSEDGVVVDHVLTHIIALDEHPD